MFHIFISLNNTRLLLPKTFQFDFSYNKINFSTQISQIKSVKTYIAEKKERKNAKSIRCLIPSFTPSLPRSRSGRAWTNIFRFPINKMNNKTFAKCLMKIVKRKITHPHIWQIISLKTKHSGSYFDGVTLDVLAKSLAKLKQNNIFLNGLIAEIAISNIEKFEYRHLTSILSSFIRTDYINEPLGKTLLKYVACLLPENINEVSSNDIGLLCEAFTASNMVCSEALQLITEIIFGSQKDLLSFGSSSLISSNSSSFDLDVSKSYLKINLSSTNLCSVIKCFSHFNCRHKDLWRLLTYEVYNKMNEMSPHLIATILKSFAISFIREERIFTCMEKRLIEGIDLLSSSDLSNILYSYAFLNIKSEILFNQLIKVFTRKINVLDKEDLLQIIIAFSCFSAETSKYEISLLFAAVPKFLYLFSLEEILILLGALRKLNHKNLSMLDSVRRLVELQLTRYAAEDQHKKFSYETSRVKNNSKNYFDFLYLEYSKIMKEKEVYNNFILIANALSLCNYSNTNLSQLVTENVVNFLWRIEKWKFMILEYFDNKIFFVKRYSTFFRNRDALNLIKDKNGDRITNSVIESFINISSEFSLNRRKELETQAFFGNIASLRFNCYNEQQNVQSFDSSMNNKSRLEHLFFHLYITDILSYLKQIYLLACCLKLFKPNNFFGCKSIEKIIFQLNSFIEMYICKVDKMPLIFFFNSREQPQKSKSFDFMEYTIDSNETRWKKSPNEVKLINLPTIYTNNDKKYLKLLNDFEDKLNETICGLVFSCMFLISRLNLQYPLTLIQSVSKLLLLSARKSNSFYGSGSNDIPISAASGFCSAAEFRDDTDTAFPIIPGNEEDLIKRKLSYATDSLKKVEEYLMNPSKDAFKNSRYFFKHSDVFMNAGDIPYFERINFDPLSTTNNDAQNINRKLNTDEFQFSSRSKIVESREISGFYEICNYYRNIATFFWLCFLNGSFFLRSLTTGVSGNRKIISESPALSNSNSNTLHLPNSNDAHFIEPFFISKNLTFLNHKNHTNFTQNINPDMPKILRKHINNDFDDSFNSFSIFRNLVLFLSKAEWLLKLNNIITTLLCDFKGSFIIVEQSSESNGSSIQHHKNARKSCSHCRNKISGFGESQNMLSSNTRNSGFDTSFQIQNNMENAFETDQGCSSNKLFLLEIMSGLYQYAIKLTVSLYMLFIQLLHPRSKFSCYTDAVSLENCNLKRRNNDSMDMIGNITREHKLNVAPDEATHYFVNDNYLFPQFNCNKADTNDTILQKSFFQVMFLSIRILYMCDIYGISPKNEQPHDKMTASIGLSSKNYFIEFGLFLNILSLLKNKDLFMEMPYEIIRWLLHKLNTILPLPNIKNEIETVQHNKNMEMKHNESDMHCGEKALSSISNEAKSFVEDAKNKETDCGKQVSSQKITDEILSILSEKFKKSYKRYANKRIKIAQESEIFNDEIVPTENNTCKGNVQTIDFTVEHNPRILHNATLTWLSAFFGPVSIIICPKKQLHFHKNNALHEIKWWESIEKHKKNVCKTSAFSDKAPLSCDLTDEYIRFCYKMSAELKTVEEVQSETPSIQKVFHTEEEHPSCYTTSFPSKKTELCKNQLGTKSDTKEEFKNSKKHHEDGKEHKMLPKWHVPFRYVKHVPEGMSVDVFLKDFSTVHT